MILTLTAIALGAKWIAGVGAGAGGGYAASRFVWRFPEVTAVPEELEEATLFEQAPGQSGDVCGVEAEVAEARLCSDACEDDEFARRVAALASRATATPEVLVARTAFMRSWVAQLRLEFPLRSNRPSDRAAMSKWLAAQLRKKGVRATHAAAMVPRAVALALNKGRDEILADIEAEAARVRTFGGRRVYEMLRSLGMCTPELSRPHC